MVHLWFEWSDGPLNGLNGQMVYLMVGIVKWSIKWFKWSDGPLNDWNSQMVH